MKTVAEIISQWTPEERERFKDLIKECQDREIKIEENLKISLDGLKRIVDAKLAEVTYPIHMKEGKA